MAFSVLESWENQSSGVSIESSGKGTTDVSRYFTVSSTVVGVSTVQVLGAAGLPQRNSPHPVTPSLRARRFNVSQEGPLYFTVTVGYEGSTADPNDPSENPLSQPPNISFGSVTQEVEIDKDINDAPIQTINAEPIQGVTAPFTDLTITVQRNLPSFNPLSISENTNKVNSATWYGLPAGTVRIMDIQARSVFSDDFAYWDVSITFQVRRGTGPVTDAKAWWFRTAHQGYIERVGADNVIAKTDDTPPLTVAQPVMLNLTTGVRLAAGVGAFIEFQILDEIDFNQLNLL